MTDPEQPDEIVWRGVTLFRREPSNPRRPLSGRPTYFGESDKYCVWWDDNIGKWKARVSLNVISDADSKRSVGDSPGEALDHAVYRLVQGIADLPGFDSAVALHRVSKVMDT